jgi:predicted alpha/beta-fold hydrolase
MAGTAGLRAFIERLPPFRARLPWLGGDLQTIRNALVKPRPPIENWPAEAIAFDMADGTGDRLHGLLHRPHAGRPGMDRPRPLALLIHGIGGSRESSYIRTTAVHLLRAGYPVLRLNLRGAGGEATQEFYHAGRTQDLKSVIGALDGRLAAQGVVPIGFSLGANMVLKYLAESGAMAPVMAAISISAPIDLAAAQRRIARRRNRFYQGQMLGWLRSERGVKLPPQLRTMLEFDTHVVAPANGFKDAQDYYRQCSAGSSLGAIRRPTLLIHAEDDPWIPAENYRGIESNPSLIPLVLHSGGHVGFHASGLDVPWHDFALTRFLGALG